MRKTHVVTCFVLDAEGRVLLLRRSERVGTYRGRWAGVSGYLETGPEQQARTELAEEVGLEDGDVTLLKEGEPMEVPDAALDQTWVIHPFLFSVIDPTKVRLDWENVELRWIDPADLPLYPTVPGLADALHAVLREA